MNKLFFLVLGLALVVNAQYDQRHWDLNNINNNLDGVNRNLNNINNTLEGIRQEQHYRTILQDQREHQKFFYERLYQAHPDANRIINSEDFKTFISHYGKKTAQGILQPFVYKKKNIYKNSPDRLIGEISKYKQYVYEKMQAEKMLLDVHPDAKQLLQSEEYGQWLSKGGIEFHKRKTDLCFSRGKTQILTYAQINIEALSAYKEYQRKKAFYQALYQKHPDVQKIVKTKAFHDWFAKEYHLPLEAVFRPVDAKGNPQSPDQAIVCLDQYKKTCSE